MLRYKRIRASEPTRQNLAVLTVSLAATVAVMFLTDASWQAKFVAAAISVLIGALVAKWLLRPEAYYCYLVADTTDLQNNASPYLWIHADGPVPPGSAWISPWGSKKGSNEYHAVNKSVPWTYTSPTGFKTAVCLPPGDYSIDFTAQGHLNWEERLIVSRGHNKLTQEVTIIPLGGEPFSPDIVEH